jgi:hypothetical protein
LTYVQPDVVLTNVGRGQLIDDDALLAHLQKDRNRDMEVRVDVIRKEWTGVKGRSLFQMPQVKLTPHRAAYFRPAILRKEHENLFYTWQMIRGERSKSGLFTPEELLWAAYATKSDHVQKGLLQTYYASGTTVWLDQSYLMLVRRSLGLFWKQMTFITLGGEGVPTPETLERLLRTAGLTLASRQVHGVEVTAAGQVWSTWSPKVRSLESHKTPLGELPGAMIHVVLSRNPLKILHSIYWRVRLYFNPTAASPYLPRAA